MTDTNTRDLSVLTADVIDRYRWLLGYEKLPVTMSEDELHTHGIQNRHTLKNDRLCGRGIPYQQDRPGGKIRYLTLDVLYWLESNRVSGDLANTKRSTVSGADRDEFSHTRFSEVPCNDADRQYPITHAAPTKGASQHCG